MLNELLPISLRRLKVISDGDGVNGDNFMVKLTIYVNRMGLCLWIRIKQKKLVALKEANLGNF